MTSIPVFPLSNTIFELSYVDMRGWLDSPLFYPRCQRPSSWSCTRFRAVPAAHSTVTSQDTRMAMTLTGYTASPTA